MTWPNFFIVGTSKAGTSSLYNYLTATDDVYLAPKGEIHYFFPEEFKKNNSKEEYLSLFENTKEKAIGEYSSYLEDIESPHLIKSTIPNSKVIICLRDPVERAFSHYLGSRRSKDEILPFNEAFEKYMVPIDKKSKFYKKYIELGLYYENVKRFLDVFGNDKVMIIIFEEYIKEPEKIFRKILDFLQVKSEIPSIVGKTYNAYAEPLGNVGNKIIKNEIINRIAKKILSKELRVTLLRIITNKRGKKPSLSQDQRKFLENFYINDSTKLEKFLDYKLPWSFLN